MASRQNEVDFRPAVPCFGSFTVTKSDSTVFAPICRKLYVGGTGDVVVRMLDGTTPLFKAVPVGTMLDLGQFDQVLNATTATLMVALY